MTSPTSQKVGTASTHVRTRLVETLQIDLVGPGPGSDLEERLPRWVRPSTWYLTGFLIPSGTPPERRADADENEDIEEIPESAGLAEESDDDRRSAKKGFFPSSIGLSFLVPGDAQQIGVTTRWGDYSPGEVKDVSGKTTQVWQRTPREQAVAVALGREEVHKPRNIPGSRGLQLYVVERLIAGEEFTGHILLGTKSVSIFLVNHRSPEADPPDVAYAFQAEIEVRSDKPFVPRPDPRGILAEDWDEQVADLHYAESPEYATGHGVSAQWELSNSGCHVVRTSWLPTAEVERTAVVDIPGVELAMDVLGALADGEAARSALSPMVAAYRDWVRNQAAGVASLSGSRAETAEQLLRNAELAANRIAAGIDVLASDDLALDAFRVLNRAVARAMRHRLKQLKEPLSWRPFQLAFILLNLPGLSDSNDPHREIVDLLFFPTGGGKTEAYLALAAYAMVLRRLRHPGDGGRGGAGVAVVMRYTLRLLTLDQLARAAGLVCALELERRAATAKYGEWPFEIGLWVGKGATPNNLGRKGDQRSDTARAKTRQFKADPRGRPAPIPLENCPWCGTRFSADSFTLMPNDDEPTELRVVCVNFQCDFSRETPLPIHAVDEPIYRRLPAFLIATVDKFAALPWVGPSGMLLGGADRYDASGFYGPAEPGRGSRLASSLPPPDLVIQDELHLISGPLGTMVGLYETAIDALCVRQLGDRLVRPKIVASTATVRRAQDQIQALFARSITHVFPPPGRSRSDSFFARTVPVTAEPGRLYLGVAAQGRNPKEVMRRVWLALMASSQKAYSEAGGGRTDNNPADPYMTVLGYFNSLKELGGARRVVEEQIQNSLKGYSSRHRMDDGARPFQDRKTFAEVLELTSRVSTAKVAEARRRLEMPFKERDHVDCALATNMISVGLDIPRLGLMVVNGQPKTHAEYIQATSRVGRDETRPGLVVTLLNMHKPRDRSHFERFRQYHETFYRSVEVGSVTPFSARSLDRGLAGALVAFARHAQPELSPPRGAEEITKVRAVLEQRLLEAMLSRVRAQPFADEAERDERLQSVRSRVVGLLDSWEAVLSDFRDSGVQLQYQEYELRNPRPLLRDMLDDRFESDDHRKFRAGRSLRDVEPEVNLFLRDLARTGGAT